MRRLRKASTILLLIVIVASPAAAARSWLRAGTWSDSRHGWVACDQRVVCSTENGGRSWQRIFTGGNYLFSVVRTSSRSGVVQTGHWVGESFWTRSNGKRWYELPNVPVPDYMSGDRPLVFEGRGHLLFWHESAATLNQISPWPAPADPPCRGRSWPGANTCVLSLGDSPFTSRAVATLDEGTLGAMRPIPGGVVVLVHADDANASPAAVLVHRLGANDVTGLPDPPVTRRSLTCTDLLASGATIFVTARSDDLQHDCPQLPLVLWSSVDGGATWAVESTERVGRVASSTDARSWGRRVAIPGGWVAASRSGPPAIAIRQLAATRRVTLPGGRRCRVVSKLVVSWPRLFVGGRRPDKSTSIRWWSDDGGATWSVFGAC